MVLHAILCVLLLSLPTIVLALPNASPPEAAAVVAREARIAAFDAQRPMHTTALLAGAAAASPAASLKGRAKSRDVRIRDLQTLTGESGTWVNLDDLRRGTPIQEDDDDVDGDNDTNRVTEKSASIREREGWRMHAAEI